MFPLPSSSLEIEVIYHKYVDTMNLFIYQLQYPVIQPCQMIIVLYRPSWRLRGGYGTVQLELLEVTGRERVGW